MVGNLKPGTCQRSRQLTRISVEGEAAGPVPVANAINPQRPTAALSCPPAARGSGLSAPQLQLYPTHSQMQNASRAQSCCAATVTPEGLAPKAPVLSSRKGQLASGVRR